MTRKNVQKERRLQIMEALHKCLLKKPFDQTSIKEIAAAAKMNHGMLHYYFQSKEDILLHYIEFVIDRYKTLFEEWMETESATIEKPEDFVRAGFNFVYHKITLNRDLSKIFIEIWEIANYNRKVKEKLKTAYYEWIAVVNRILTGTPLDEKAAARMSVALVALWEGISLFSVILDKETIELETLLTDFQEQFLKIFILNGGPS